MPGSYTALYDHLVWRTKYRRPQITADISERLYSFIGGIIRDERGSMLAVGGVPDHIHVLVRWRPDASLSNLLRDVKTRSSRWAHETLELPEFRWQASAASPSAALDLNRCAATLSVRKNAIGISRSRRS